MTMATTRWQISEFGFQISCAQEVTARSAADLKSAINLKSEFCNLKFEDWR
jgi:hypothetical protein